MVIGQALGKECSTEVTAGCGCGKLFDHADCSCNPSRQNSLENNSEFLHIMDEALASEMPPELNRQLPQLSADHIEAYIDKAVAVATF